MQPQGRAPVAAPTSGAKAGKKDVVLVTGSYDHTVRYWRARSADQTGILQLENQVNCLALSPDATRLAVGSYQALRVYLVGTDQGVSETGGIQQNVTGVAFNPANPAIICSAVEDGRLLVWELRPPPGGAPGLGSLHLLRTVVCPAPLNCIAFHPSGSHCVVGGQRGVISSVDMAALGAESPKPDARGVVHHTLAKDETSVRSLSFSPGAGALVAAVNNNGRFFAFGFMPALAAVPADDADTAPSPDPKPAAPAAPAAADTAPAAEAEEPAVEFEDAPGVAAPTDAAPEESTDSNAWVAANPAAAVKLLATFEAHRKYGLCVRVSPAGNVVCTTSADCTALLWALPADLGQRLEEVRRGVAVAVTTAPWVALTSLPHARWVWDCAFSRQGKYLATVASDSTLRLWSNGVVQRQFTGHTRPITCVAMDADDDTPAPAA